MIGNSSLCEDIEKEKGSIICFEIQIKQGFSEKDLEFLLSQFPEHEIKHLDGIPYPLVRLKRDYDAYDLATMYLNSPDALPIQDMKVINSNDTPIPHPQLPVSKDDPYEFKF